MFIPSKLFTFIKRKIIKAREKSVSLINPYGGLMKENIPLTLESPQQVKGSDLSTFSPKRSPSTRKSLIPVRTPPKDQVIHIYLLRYIYFIS